MRNFDTIVTDRRVTLGQCNAQLTGASRDPYLLGEYTVIASGGSSGRRGVFVYGWDAWAICYASNMRLEQRDWQTDPTLAGVPRITAVVAASAPAHISAALGRTFSSPSRPRHIFPVSQPIEAIMAGLNHVQPTVLRAYSSFLSPAGRRGSGRPVRGR